MQLGKDLALLPDGLQAPYVILFVILKGNATLKWFNTTINELLHLN
jgi:hypothetical protein